LSHPHLHLRIHAYRTRAIKAFQARDILGRFVRRRKMDFEDMKKKQLLTWITCAACGVAGAQEMNPTANHQWPQQQQQQPQAEMRDGVPVYKVTVVGRDIPAINYFHRSGSTKIGFQGTSLMAQSKGSATVESRRGRMVIDAKFEGLVPANSFGVEYLTYVLWAITPEGRPVNLGEVLPDGSKSEITVTTDLQAYGLIVTAEPYYAVTMPSDLVVLQNVVLPDKTQGILEQVNAHFSLLPRGAYVQTAGEHSVLHPINRNERSPLELYEAINAIQIAEAEGADKYAADTLATAKQDLANAQDFDEHKKDRKQEITYAREAVQTSEDARIMTIRKMKAEDDLHQQQARMQAEQSAQQSALAAQQAAAEQAQAEARAAEAEAAAERAKAEQAAAQHQAQQATDQTEQMREKLKTQLSAVLETRETARGLIVNMSDVLFDFNKYTLKTDAREKLAKVSGILLSYPGLNLQVEGYTDNVGTDEYNQKLSEERADAVRDYLQSQGVAQSNISAAGYGKSDPVADNSSASGRAENRRVQLVVSGNAIGVQESAPTSGGAASMNPPQPPAQQQAAKPYATGVSSEPQQ
jgi:outer membrane protein OmpA-like peptidoglycan-associated protein